MGKTEQKIFKCVGFNKEQGEDDPAHAMQQEDDLTEEEKSILRQTAGRIGWLGREARPDLVIAQIEMSTKFLSGKVKDLVRDEFFIRRLGPVESWAVEVSTDTSLSNLNEGVYSVESRIILKYDKGDCAQLLWGTNKIKRIVDFMLEAECLSLLSRLKKAIYFREVIEEIFSLKDEAVSVKDIVDNKSTKDAIDSTAPVEDKTLRREVTRIKQMLGLKEIQLADCITKRTASSFKLMKVFKSGRRD